jgi:hypothetical protein
MFSEMAKTIWSNLPLIFDFNEKWKIIFVALSENLTFNQLLTLVYRIEEKARLLIWREIPTYTVLFWSARLSFMKSSSPLHT